MSWYDTVGQSYATPAKSNAKQDNTWDVVNTMLGAYNPLLGAVGKVGQFAYGYYGGKQQRKDAISARNQQQDFQESMSNTAHQRQMADMRSAGLNPILSGKYGGANTPSGSTFTPDNQALKNAQVIQATSNARTAMAQAELNEQNAKYFRNKSFGSAVLNARPTNILLTEILERNPQLIDKLSNLVGKGVDFTDDPLGIIASLFESNNPPTNAKTIPRGNSYKLPKVNKTKLGFINKIFDGSSFLRGKRYRLGDLF